MLIVDTIEHSGTESSSSERATPGTSLSQAAAASPSTPCYGGTKQPIRPSARPVRLDLPSSTSDAAYLSIEQFSQLSGLSQSTIRRRIRDRSLASSQPGGPGKKILIPRDALDRSAPTSTNEIAPVLTPEKPPATRRGPRPGWQQR